MASLGEANPHICIGLGLPGRVGPHVCIGLDLLGRVGLHVCTGLGFLGRVGLHLCTGPALPGRLGHCPCTGLGVPAHLGDDGGAAAATQFGANCVRDVRVVSTQFIRQTVYAMGWSHLHSSLGKLCTRAGVSQLHSS